MLTDNLPELQLGNMHIFIQVMDSDSGLAIYEIYLGQFPINCLVEIIDCGSGGFRQNNPIYIEDDKLAELGLKFEIDENILYPISKGCRPENSDLGILTWSPGGGNLPYRLHTGRELLLMIGGSKPLSVFTGRIPADDSLVEIPEHLFDPYVEDGILQKREIREMQERPVRGIEGHRVVLYARKGEEWRLDAYALVRSVGNKIGWSEPLIRLEGTLLGYQDWQNDAYIARMKWPESRG